MLNIKGKEALCSVLILILLMVITINVSAVDTVKIGAIYPMTGPMANYGEGAVNSLKLAVDIVNKEYPNLGFNLAPTAGLPNLGGAKIEMIFANSQGEAEFGKSEAERLITIDKVDALIGTYQSAVTKTASQVAERYKVPFITGNSSAYELTERGYKYFFRISATDVEYAQNMLEFLKGLNEKGANIQSIALLYSDTLAEVENSNSVKRLFSEEGKEFFNIIADIRFPFKAADLDGEVINVKNLDPDFLIVSVTDNDLITLLKSMQKFNYTPKVGICGSIAGLLQVQQILGTEAVNYIMSKDVFALDLAATNPLISEVNKLYHDQYGLDLDLNNSREFTAMMVLADAINRAGSTNKEEIRKALAETDMPSSQLILPWKGIKFNDKGQCIYAQWIFRQMINGKLVTVWPFEVAAAEVVLPMPKWDER